LYENHFWKLKIRKNIKNRGRREIEEEGEAGSSGD